ncbi:hypothetical protein CEXT_286261 [Caerostris extrusa]|uniref:Uncharacterized protein n=1 Tax=Caerostris extrusa TaxID=172846 RepID=A0AAV4N8X0_CAEEX|nr:hypothetical protein CEXT_286261 [Caerostris extrusa]
MPFLDYLNTNYYLHAAIAIHLFLYDLITINRLSNIGSSPFKTLKKRPPSYLYLPITRYSLEENLIGSGTNNSTRDFAAVHKYRQRYAVLRYDEEWFSLSSGVCGRGDNCPGKCRPYL